MSTFFVMSFWIGSICTQCLVWDLWHSVLNQVLEKSNCQLQHQQSHNIFLRNHLTCWSSQTMAYSFSKTILQDTHILSLIECLANHWSQLIIGYYQEKLKSLCSITFPPILIQIIYIFYMYVHVGSKYCSCNYCTCTQTVGSLPIDH